MNPRPGLGEALMLRISHELLEIGSLQGPNRTAGFVIVCSTREPGAPRNLQGYMLLGPPTPTIRSRGRWSSLALAVLPRSGHRAYLRYMGQLFKLGNSFLYCDTIGNEDPIFCRNGTWYPVRAAIAGDLIVEVTSQGYEPVTNDGEYGDDIEVPRLFVEGLLPQLNWAFTYRRCANAEDKPGEYAGWDVEVEVRNAGCDHAYEADSELELVLIEAIDTALHKLDAERPQN